MHYIPCMTRAARGSITGSLCIIASLVVWPLSCVLTCLVGGCCLPPVPGSMASASEVSAGVTASAAAGWPTTTRKRRTEATHRCCDTRSATVCRPETTDAPRQVVTDGQGVVKSHRGWVCATLWDETGCLCHPTKPSRFTASPCLVCEAPLPTETAEPVALKLVVPLRVLPRAIKPYVPSHAKTYLKCCVFRI